MKKYNKNLVKYSQDLRKEMTPQERHLWYDFLKELPIIVNRQKVIGNYIVDFYCAKAKLVIEIDGSQHYESEGKEKDEIRDNYLNSLGINVFRCSNSNINNNFDEVCENILKCIEEDTSSTASGPPSPQGEG